MDELSDREQDNQNTNRNEACAASAGNELLSSVVNGLTETKPAESDEPLSEEGNAFQIPTVIITAPSENENEMTDDSAQVMTMSMDEMCIEEANIEDLVEKEKPLEASNGVDTASDDEFEVICRCSSTPLSVNDESLSNIPPLKGVMSSSVDEASPVRNDKSATTKDSESLGQTPNNAYIQSQYFTHPQQGKEVAHDVSIQGEEFENPQLQNAPVYDSSPVVSFSQQIPVYNVNGTTVTYVSGPQPAASVFPAYQREGGCQVQPQNGYATNYVGKTEQQLMEDTQHDEATASSGQSQADAGSPFQQPDMYNFVYPSLYVSNAGLISVLLRHDMSVEMTVDRTIRVVSHQHMMAVATDSRGTSACLYHPALKVIQQDTTTDIATDAVRVHMGHDDVAFAIGHSRYRFDAFDIQPATHVKFSDIFKDQSVNLLFSSEGYGESLVPQCLEVASKAEYANLPKGGVIVRINGVKVTQTGGGDVTVVTGAKFIRLSPSFGMTRLGNRFIDIEIERDWSSRVSRGPHCFFAGDRRVIISNGKLEVDVNEHGRFKVAHLQPRRPVTPQQCLRQPENYVRRVNSVTYTASSAARAAVAAARAPPTRRRSAPVGVSL